MDFSRPSRFPSGFALWKSLGSREIGRRGWISQYLPRLGGARIQSLHLHHTGNSNSFSFAVKLEIMFSTYKVFGKETEACFTFGHHGNANIILRKYPPCGVTCIGCKFGHQMAPLGSVAYCLVASSRVIELVSSNSQSNINKNSTIFSISK